MTASETSAARVRVDDVALHERTVKLRLPFRFGVVTIRDAVQITANMRISLPDGRSAVGMAAESLLPKWFDKDPALSDEENVEQLRRSVAIAIGLYRRDLFETPFGLYASSYREQMAIGASHGLNPLVASYGPALLDRAVLDAIGKLHGRSFQALIKTNAPGISITELTPELEGFDIARFLSALPAYDVIDVRHTVGFIDPLTAADRTGAPLDDGLPETLEEVVAQYGCRYYKLKVCGDVAADLDRLTGIAAVLDRGAGNYRTTLDGNEQYDDVDGITELWRRMSETPSLRKLVSSVLFIEQPIKRSVALQRSVHSLAEEKPLIIDESDGDLSSFPTALTLGYTGVSSKNCKGLYKSILNAARVARLNEGLPAPKYFQSAEDLCIWSGASLQQDLALVSLLGLTHVERNGHHFIDGMSFAPEAEQQAFVTAHPRLYHKQPGRPARLSIRAGALDLSSLACPGFAIGVD